MKVTNNGKLGELSAITYFTQQEYDIYVPLGGCGSCDFVAIKGSELIRVEVKSTRAKDGSIDLRRQRNNTTKERTKFDSSKSDVVFLVNLITNKFRIVNSSELENRRSVRV